MKNEKNQGVMPKTLSFCLPVATELRKCYKMIARTWHYYHMMTF